MAGKVRGMKNKGISSKRGDDLPTAKWQSQHEQEPHKAGPTLVGAKLKSALARSRGAMGVGKRI